MSWDIPISIGLGMGLIFAGPAIALAVAFRLLNFPDLTLEGSFPTGAAVFAAALVAGWPAPFAVVAAILAGASLGAATGLIHAGLHVNRFLAGILVVAMSYTLDLRVMTGPNIGLSGHSSFFDLVPTFGPPELQLGVLLTLVAIVSLVMVMLNIVMHSRWGLGVRTSGSNPAHARALGMRPSLRLMAGLALTNAVVAFSGVMLAMYQGFADVGMGQGGLVLALASLTIGEALIPQSRLTIVSYVLFSAIIGSLVYQILVACALRLGLAASDLKLATALFVLAVIALRVRRAHGNMLEAET